MTNSFPEEIWARPDFTNWGEGFWSRARVHIILDILARHGITDILDVGAGNGQLVSLPLSQAGISVTCLEPLHSGAEKARALGLPTRETRLEDAGLPEGSVSAVGLFDVIEDSPDPALLLAEAARVVRPGGLVIVSVPGHPWLYSDYDEAVGTLRRYTRTSLTRELSEAGLQVTKVCGVFSSLVPYAFLTRRVPYLLGKRRSRESFGQVSSSAAHLPRPLSAVLESLAVADFRLGSPLGLSIFAVAMRPRPEDAS